ncbi:hypothetical protein NPIL_534541 [Nephila pilipes]|uniref:Uncharacterized protein n=1 Tax=Nephila pilipes TaxID=299642 RepID=A0A8X6P488_NEPPI|nr:hypothetical protein NPIL_534541 [Nephila pilipes]
MQSNNLFRAAKDAERLLLFSNLTRAYFCCVVVKGIAPVSQRPRALPVYEVSNSLIGGSELEMGLGNVNRKDQDEIRRVYSEVMKKCVLFVFFCLLSSAVAGFHDHLLMKSLLHGAGMGMMMQQMRPRILPIPIPIPTGLFAGFRRQFEQPQVIVVQAQKPREKIIIIGGGHNEQCCW